LQKKLRKSYHIPPQQEAEHYHLGSDFDDIIFLPIINEELVKTAPAHLYGAQ